MKLMTSATKSYNGIWVWILTSLTLPSFVLSQKAEKGILYSYTSVFSCRPVKLIMSEWELCSIPPITFSKLFGMLLPKKKKKIGMPTIDHGSSSASSWLGLGLQPWPICSGPYSSTRNINTKAFFLKMKIIFFSILKYFCILFVLEKRGMKQSENIIQAQLELG